MAQGFKPLFFLLLMACLGSGGAAHISLPSYHKETSTSPPEKSGPCGVNSCGQGSTCQPRASQTFVCLCLVGDWYNYISKSCEKAKVFPGQLILPQSPYKAQMNDMSSIEFLNGSKEIIDWLNVVFSDSARYLESTVLKLEENKPQSRFWSRAENGVIATVDIIFDTRAVITTEEVKGKIENFTCTSCTLSAANFTSEDLCNRYPCDTETTASCSSKDGIFNCPCKDDYIQTAFSGSRKCIDCPNGQKVVDSECVYCPFGYSGFNCSDSWLLILVIVGSTLGGLLITTLILLLVVANISSQKSSKKNKNANMRNLVFSHSAAEAHFVNRGLASSQTAAINWSTDAFSNARVPRIPRATTPSNWDRTNPRYIHDDGRPFNY